MDSQIMATLLTQKRESQRAYMIMNLKYFAI